MGLRLIWCISQTIAADFPHCKQKAKCDWMQRRWKGTFSSKSQMKLCLDVHTVSGGVTQERVLIETFRWLGKREWLLVKIVFSLQWVCGDFRVRFLPHIAISFAFSPLPHLICRWCYFYLPKNFMIGSHLFEPTSWRCWRKHTQQCYDNSITNYFIGIFS